LEALKAPLLRYHACLFLGHIHRAAGESHAAYKAYGEARFYLESLRGSLQGEELKIAFLKNKLDVYENLVGLCLGRGSKTANEEAFHYMERAKSRSLADLLFGRAPQRSWQKSTSLQARRIRALREELNWFYHRIEVEEAQTDKTSAHRIESLRTEASRCENHLLRALRELPSDVHGPGLLQAATAMPFDELCAALNSEATLLEYFQIGSQFLVAAVTRDGLKIVPLEDSARIDASVRMLDFHWSKFRLRRRYLRTFEADLVAAANNHLHELYRVLVEPLISDLKGNHLIIGPHGSLHRVPFHALSTGTEYLIDRFTISYAPSATIYAICERKGCRSAGGSLLLGVHDKNTPWIRREIQSVAAVVPGAEVFLGTQATMEVLTTRGPESRVIHVATHGFFRRDNPMFSCVRLGDGYLSLYDLYGVNLPVELFTLSGCGTGLNVIAAGDEQMGLARGLLCAGAQSVLLTLWDVNDRTTAEFMASFYRHLQQQLQKPTALQAAMHEVRARYSHPYYWAPFVLLGKAFRTEA
jgi:CHAT domain-containing protein